MVSRKTIPEQELIELLASRDVKGLEYLYDRYSAALYGVIHRIVGVQERSEEILQETFLRIWERVRHYDPAKGRLFTWMLNIARNLAIDAVRSREFRNTGKTIRWKKRNIPTPETALTRKPSGYETS